MANSTARRRTRKAAKPRKPYPEFPLFPHATGRWAKKIRRKLVYFGKIADDPDGTAAVAKLNREWEDLKNGRTPRPVVAEGDGLTFDVLCNEFLNSKRKLLLIGELSESTFADYLKTTDRLIAYFGKDRRVDDLRPKDFENLRTSMARKWGPKTIANQVIRMRVVFKYAYEQELIDKPVRFGQSFSRPSMKNLRKARNQAGPRMFEPGELHRVLAVFEGKHVAAEDEGDAPKADPQMVAMVLLGLNCGFGNTDCGTLPKRAVDLDGGWISYPRPKTEIPRRIPLWEETVAALRKAMAVRPEPKDRGDAGLVFLTIQGNPWVRVVPGKKVEERYVRRDSITSRFGRVLKYLKINGRMNLGFYTLRHVFATIAGECRDQVAVNSVMGHIGEGDSMASTYRERISDERLRDAVNTVRAWLWPEATP